MFGLNLHHDRSARLPWRSSGTRVGRRQFVVGGLLALGSLLFAGGAVAQEGDVINREYPLKALFLYHFGHYVEWPAASFRGPDSPFVIGVLGGDPILETLTELAQTKRINGRAIVVRRFASPAAIEPCQILFLGRDISREVHQAAIDGLRDKPVMLVGETRGFAHRGGTVNFVVESNKIRFEINLEAARQHQLKISSKLLALSRIVQQPAEEQRTGRSEP